MPDDIKEKNELKDEVLEKVVGGLGDGGSLTPNELKKLLELE